MRRSSRAVAPRRMEFGLPDDSRLSAVSDGAPGAPTAGAKPEMQTQLASPHAAMRKASKRTRRMVDDLKSASPPPATRSRRSAVGVIPQESLAASEITQVTGTPRARLSLAEESAVTPTKHPSLQLDARVFSPLTRSRSSPIGAESPAVNLSAKENQQPPSNVAQRLALSHRPSELVGREKEQKILFELLQGWGRANSAGFIYVCGMPGSGKTLTISSVVKRISSKSISINCAKLSDPTRIFDVILGELGVKHTYETRRHARQALFTKAAELRRPVVIVLDELDFLTSRDQNTLYSLFEIPRLKSSTLSIVGIANSLDLPQRLLPWLRSTNSMPHVVPFEPYNAATLISIISQRVRGKNGSMPPDSPLDPTAIRLCALKVAAGSGDARVALDTCRMAVQSVSERKAPSCLPVVSSILQSKGGIATALKAIANLPMHQQLVLYAAYRRFQRKRSSKELSLRELFQSFVSVCSQVHVDKLSFSQFADICRGSLAHHDLVHIKDSKDNRSVTMRLKVSDDDVKEALAQNRLFNGLLT